MTLRDTPRIARITDAGTQAVIVPLGSRSAAIRCDKDVYEKRDLAERCFDKIKYYRGIAAPQQNERLLHVEAWQYLAGELAHIQSAPLEHTRHERGSVRCEDPLSAHKPVSNST